MQPAQMAYDRAITVFSPDGRLFQVEYAREAVRWGSTAIGIKFKDGVVLIAEKRFPSKLVEGHSIEKIFRIDDHIGCATSGIVADARVLVDYARVVAQIERVTYGERITVEALVKKVADLVQQYTQFGGVRPFGTSLLIAGVDDTGVYLYESDPSGTIMGYRAWAIGRGKDDVVEMLEKEYKDDMSEEEAILLGFRTLNKVLQEEGEWQGEVEVGVVRKGTGFEILSKEIVDEYMKRVEEE